VQGLECAGWDPAVKGLVFRDSSIRDGVERQYVEGLKQCIAEVPDPRVVGRCDHLLLDIVALTILAVFCGAEDWPDVESFGKKRLAWLKAFLELPHGIPSHDTFRRVFGLLQRNLFAQALFQWTQALQEATGGKIIGIDGKALRRSCRRQSGTAMLHLVTAGASENGLTLGQVACEDKSNEITAIPQLLKQLSLKGCTVTIDARGCQQEIAAQIRKQKAHDVLALKGNQSGLQEELQEFFIEALETDFEGHIYSQAQTHDTGHGRTDERTDEALEIPKDPPQRRIWKDLRSVVAATSHRTVNETETDETRYDISSHPPQAKPLGHAIRRHWAIENGQHGVLDVAFGEDQRRQQDRNGAANLAAVRRLVLSLLRQEKTNKRGAKNKQFECALDPQYLLQVLATTRF
jgi:predicted transposase YbfD/YdcC